jgi:hypothetical protein
MGRLVNPVTYLGAEYLRVSVFATVLREFCFKNTESALGLNRYWYRLPKAGAGKKNRREICDDNLSIMPQQAEEVK